MTPTCICFGAVSGRYGSGDEREKADIRHLTPLRPISANSQLLKAAVRKALTHGMDTPQSSCGFLSWSFKPAQSRNDCTALADPYPSLVYDDVLPRGIK